MISSPRYPRWALFPPGGGVGGWVEPGGWHTGAILNGPNIYHFHQKNGFACMLLSDLFELGQFVFVVAFSAFLLCCVRYDVLFADRPLNRSHVPPERSKVTLPDAVLPAPQCARRIAASGWLVFLLAMAALFWLCRLLKVLRGLLAYWDIRRFYGEALRIPAVSGTEGMAVGRQCRCRGVGSIAVLSVPRRCRSRRGAGAVGTPVPCRC
uniref:Autophagy-related protein 9 n=1 Tax=Meleagris gallopavo TaxID=9103 RepID=A0A803YA15_MELGA